MANRNQTKQRRQARNRAEREAREVRRVAANRPRPAAADPPTDDAAPSAKGPGRPSTRRGRRRRPQPTVGATAPGPGPLLPLLFGAVHGGRAVTMGFVFSVVASVSLLFLPFVVVETEAPDGTTATETSTLLAEEGWAVTGTLIVPVLVAAVAVAVVRRPARRRVWLWCAAAMVAWVAVTLAGIGTSYLFGAGALGLGAWQAHKGAQDEAAASLPDRDVDTADEQADRGR